MFSSTNQNIYLPGRTDSIYHPRDDAYIQDKYNEYLRFNRSAEPFNRWALENYPHVVNYNQHIVHNGRAPIPLYHGRPGIPVFNVTYGGFSLEQLNNIHRRRTKKHKKHHKRRHGDGLDPVSAVADAVGQIAGATPEIINASIAANDDRLKNQLKQRLEWRTDRLENDFVPYFDNLGQKGEIGNNSMAKYWSKYQDGKGKYNSMQEAYNSEGIAGILPILTRMIKFQIPLGPDSLVRADWDRPYW